MKVKFSISQSKLKTLLLISFFNTVISLSQINGQSNTSYSPLFTGTTFTKTINQSLTVGAIAAASDVSNGAASYTIPIVLPPGTNNVEPTVSVSYSSISGNSILGQGWSIGGLSVITRATKNIYFDQKVGPVDLNYSPVSPVAYALDGQRLVSNLGVLKTESENFTTVIGQGNTGGFPTWFSPQWFSVESKDGTVMEYGNTPDSRFMNEAGNIVLFWRLNRIKYKDGNYIDYKYTNVDRDSRIDEIIYTGNTVLLQAPFNKIKFNYSVRTDINITYEAGEKVVSKYLLDNIVVTTEDNATFKTYEFKYGINNIASYLKEVIEKGSDGSALNSTIFKYGDEPIAFSTSVTNVGQNLDANYFSADLNGDGFSDYISLQRLANGSNVWHTSMTPYIKIPDPNSTAYTSWNTITFPLNSNYIAHQPGVGANHKFTASDFNGDGADDILLTKIEGTAYPNRGCTQMKIYESNTNNGFNSIDIDLPFATNRIGPNGSFYQIGDFNGDGKSDIFKYTCSINSQNVFITSPAINFNGTSGWTLTSNTNIPDDIWHTCDKIIVIDFNGDGQDDLMLIKNSTTYIVTHDLASTNWKVLYNSGFPTKWHHLYFGDFNGDKKTDILCRTDPNNNNASWKLNISTGLAFLESNWTFNTTPNVNSNYFYDQIFINDFNGDGKSDVAHCRNTGSTTSIVDMYYSKGISGNPVSVCGTVNEGQNLTLTAPIGKVFIGAHFASYGTPNGSCGSFARSSCHANSSVNVVNNAIQGQNTASILATNSVFGLDPCSGTLKRLYVEAGINENFTLVQNTFSKTIITDPKYILAQDFNGDGRTDIFNSTSISQPNDILFFRKEGQEHLLQKIKNGYDHDIEFQYKRLTQMDNFYSRGSITAHPVNTIQVPFYLVSRQNVENGIGGYTTIDFKYEEAKLHKEGKGFLGFKKVISINTTSGFTNIVESDVNNTFYVQAVSSLSTRLNTNPNSNISFTTIENEFISLGNKRFWARINNKINNNYFEGRKTLSYMTYDVNGNVTQEITKLQNSIAGTDTDVETKTVDYLQYESWGTPIPSKPRFVTEKLLRAGQLDFITTTKYDYNTIGQVTGKTDFDGLTKNVMTTYEYNSLGNQTNITITPSGLTARSVSSQYDTKGRYAVTSTNELGQVSSATFDPKWGKPLTQTGITGLVTTFTYDAFGRLKTIFDNQQLFTISETYAWAINSTDGTIHSHLTSHPGRPDVKVYFDLMDRERKREVETYGNVWTTQKRTYDSRGNIQTSTIPYKSNETILTTTDTYDVYNRISSSSNTLGTTNYTYSYSDGKLTTTITNPASQVSSKVTDAANRLVSVTDNGGGTLNYTYYSHGGVRDVIRALPMNQSLVLTTSEYDEYGRQKKLIDINAGTTQYEYDALGQLKTMTNATNQINTYDYDVSGRKISHTRIEGNTIYTYWPSGSGGGTNQLKNVTSYGGMIEDYTYDIYGRVNTKAERVEGILHTTTFTYNAYNDVTSILYPSGFKVNYSYDANGFLTHIKNTNNTITLFTNSTMNGLGQYTSYSTGNGKSTTKSYYFGVPTNYTTPGVQNLTFNWNYQTGNLTSRVDALKSKTESFTYDNLNRLEVSSGATLTSISNTYFQNGNINTKTDVGAYTYDSSIRVNAVNYVTNSPNNISANQQDIVYRSFFQPFTISESNFQLTYTYGADDQRRKAVMRQNSAVINTRYYFGDYEKDITGGITRHLHYISNGKSLIAIVERQGSTDTYHYIYTDHLGSILTSTTNSGVVEFEQNFDAWGRNRNATTWLYASVPTPPVWLYKGYTGHEHIPQFGLINMNGRLYDPLLARMLSPDNNVQMPDNTQNYNRYSYALNNPLKYSDPDGEFIVPVVPILAGAAISVLANGAENLDNNRNFFAGAARAAIMGGISGAISFGIGQIAAGAVASGQTTALGGKVFQALAHGISGEMMSVMNGGKLGAGFLSGAISSVSSSALGGSINKLNKLQQASITITIGGVTGGIGAELADGKFIHGFRQGVITSGLNHAIHKGVFGLGLTMATITGQWRHLFGPDAVTVELESGGAVGPAAIRLAGGGAMALVGPDKGKFKPFFEFGNGFGLDWGSGGNFAEFYYTGRAESFKLSQLGGISHNGTISASLGKVIGGGISAGFAKDVDNVGNKIFILSIGLSWSPVPGFPFGASYWRNNTVIK